MKRINVDEGLGKVLTDLVEVDDGPYLLLVFSDQTYAVVSIMRGFDSDIEFDFDDPKFDPTKCFDYEGLIEAGIFTKEEIVAANAQRDAEMQAVQEAHERRTLAWLKAKYEEVSKL